LPADKVYIDLVSELNSVNIEDMFKKLNGMAMKNDNYSFIVFKNDRKKKPPALH
jgi:hypothetical protein